MVGFGDVITAMVTPFDKDLNLDLDQAKSLIKRLSNSGSESILLSGTTGESPTLTDKEKFQLFDLGVKNSGDNVKIIAGTGCYDTRHSIELSKEAEKIGVDCLLLVTPYYNKPGQASLIKHFEAIASEVDIPVILYNVPSRTSCNIDANTCIELSRIDNVVGVKEASSDLRQIAEIIRNTDDSFLVYSGNDGDTLPIMALGGNGVISVASHLVGLQIKEMIDSFRSGRTAEAAKLHNWLLDIFYGIFITTNPVPIKYALNLTGVNVGPTRPPLYGMTEDESKRFNSILGKYDLI